MTSPRVVVLTTFFRPVVGGVESTAERLARYLQHAGCAVQVVTKRVTASLPDVEDMDGVRIVRIGPRGERGGGGKWRLLPHAATWLVAHRRTYDVVCCIDYRAIGIAAVAARALTGHRVVLQAQTTGVLSGGNTDDLLRRWHLRPSGGLARLLKSPVLSAYRAADAFACISREIEREVAAAGVEPARIHYLPNAVDMTRFRPAAPGEREALREQYGVPAGAVVCLFVGRLSREKGLMDLMEAWRLASPRGGFLIVAGPDMIGHAWDVGPAAREFVSRNEWSSSVRFIGSITDVATLLRVADVAIQPSHFEALGLSAIEALGSGVPVIASGVGGLLDFVVDGENGLLHPPQDAAALAAAIRTLVESPERRLAMAARARASVIDVYDERVVFSRFTDLLRRLAQVTS